MRGQSIIDVDARGLRCPLPVLRLAKAMRDNPGAGTFRLQADDPAAAKDVPAFAAESGWTSVETGSLSWLLTRGDVDGFYTV